jgi:hypothetical protein
MAVSLSYYRERGCTQGVALGSDTGMPLATPSQLALREKRTMKEGWPKREVIIVLTCYTAACKIMFIIIQ